MKKYSSKLIMDYISGEEIDNVEELENNIDFMLQVFRAKKDTNIYKLCSDELKGNVDFVLELLDIFGKEQYRDFWFEVVNNYVKYNFANQFMKVHNINTDNIFDLSDDMIDYYEVICKLNKLNNYEHDERFIEYGLILSSLYPEYSTKFHLIKNEVVSEEETTMGFILVEDMFSNHQNMKEYFATNMIKEIFDNNYKDLEQHLHNLYGKPDNIINTGVFNYLLSLINEYDDNLADYIELHKELVDHIVYQLNHIINNWDNYIEDRHYEIHKIITDYANEHLYEGFSEYDFAKYIAKEFNMNWLLDYYKIPDEIYGYSEYDDFIDYDQYQVEEDIINEEEYRKMMLDDDSFENKKQLLILKKKIAKYLKDKKDGNNNSNNQSKTEHKDTKAKILSFEK